MSGALVRLAGMNDSAWTSEHIRGLLEGEIVLVAEDPVTGRSAELVKEVPTAFERRAKVLDGKGSFDELADSIQLSKAISTIKDRETRAFMAAALALGATNADAAAIEVEDAGLRSNRHPINVYERGVELIRKYERTQHQLLYRVRASGGVSDTPVCWRCLKTSVRRAGEECADCPALDSNWTPGPKPRSYADMTLEELVDDQYKNDADYYKWSNAIPGYDKVRHHEVPPGDDCE